MPAVVLIDTNIWVSALINPRGYPAQVVAAWLGSHFDVVMSIPLLQELVEVLNRPRIRHKQHLTEEDIQKLIGLLTDQAQMVEPRGNLHVCRDPDDDVVLETAILGHAQYAITRDDDLKMDSELAEHMRSHGVTILSVTHFLVLLQANSL